MNGHVTRIAIYGGTFDPIHNAHLILAREVYEQLELDRVLFVPALQSPHKLDSAATGACVRLEMLTAAISGEPGFTVDDRELRRLPPSYAIDTVEQIRAANSAAKLFYLIGEDNVANLETWHRIAELKQLAEFVVLERTGRSIEHNLKTIRRHVDISATDIRNRVANGRSIRYLVPPEVDDIIRRNELYREPQHHA